MFTIRNDDELASILDAVRIYNMKKKSARSDLAGTYWKKEYLSGGRSRRVDYYYVVSEDVSRKSMLRIGRWDDRYGISTNASIGSLNAVDDADVRLSSISRDEYARETAAILLRYGLRWAHPAEDPIH